jgi:site-specific DNA-methyltransferase (adenine-specific)
MLELNKIYNLDNMEGMSQFPDKYFELAIVDPPYGIGEDGKSNHSRGKMAKPKLYTPKNWDSKPPKVEYFEQLLRVSKNQIIWGANHFISRIPIDSSLWVIWDKMNGENDFADCELAWTSFDSAARLFQFRWAGMLQGNMKDKESRIHPTQKPAALYKWLLKNYANPGDKILDTHGGSFSSVIACLEMGFEYIAFEIDEEYYKNGLKRINDYLKQPKIFKPEPIKVEQSKLF